MIPSIIPSDVFPTLKIWAGSIFTELWPLMAVFAGLIIAGLLFSFFIGLFGDALEWLGDRHEQRRVKHFSDRGDRGIVTRFFSPSRMDKAEKKYNGPNFKNL